MAAKDSILKRLVSGLVMAAFATFCIVYLPTFYLQLVITVLAAMVCRECARMILPQEPPSATWFPTLTGTALTALILFGPRDFSLMTLWVPILMLVILGFYLFFHISLELAIHQISRTVLITFYIGLLFSFIGLIVDLPNGWAWLLLLAGTTFAADTGAFFSGHQFGKHKLFPRVSPGKTIEGLLGGLLLSIAVAFFFKYVIFKKLSVADCFWVGGLTGIIGPFGDLTESLIKRSVGVKDSGQLIPGHGGLLDRVDALLFTSPVVYWYATYIR